MSGQARARPSWKKQRYHSPRETIVALAPVPADDLTRFVHDLSLIDDQVLDDALRAPGVLDERRTRAGPGGR
jgi:hypothetical protein